MLYTREQIEKELCKAYAAESDAKKAHKDMQQAASDNLPDIKRNNPEWHDEYMAWKKKYDEPAKAAYNAEKSAILYRQAIAELLKSAIHEDLDAVFFSEDYLRKFDGVPVRYKRVKSYIADRFPGWSIHLGQDGYISAWFWPDSDSYYIREHFQYLRVPGKYSTVWDDVSVSRDSLDAGAGQYFREDGATFAQIKRACDKAPAIKEKRAAILEEANNKAHELAEKNAAGLHAIYDAITGR